MVLSLLLLSLLSSLLLLSLLLSLLLLLLRVGEPMGLLVWFNYSRPGSVTRGLELVSNTKEVNRCCYAVKVLCMMCIF